jgi:hypothetical protein
VAREAGVSKHMIYPWKYSLVTKFVKTPYYFHLDSMGAS